MVEMHTAGVTSSSPNAHSSQLRTKVLPKKLKFYSGDTLLTNDHNNNASRHGHKGVRNTTNAVPKHSPEEHKKELTHVLSGTPSITDVHGHGILNDVQKPWDASPLQRLPFPLCVDLARRCLRGCLLSL